ncbi:Aste57867_16229 [Aphanomyces stellatus]|uniref:Aste57867_16229 protein n=1 Tax=Aphanomyces stellatus TaxID=120398 RepID=A0A485L556_9STRA|nr:hypothetical protein As57867_016172 [Aphanomyces stellatus]VFT93007.1 Aste57867_16229 [Aphanomyces stellatus]
MRSAVELAAMEAVRAAKEFLATDHSKATSPKRPQTAVGPRERLKAAASKFYGVADDSSIVPSHPIVSPPRLHCSTFQAWLAAEGHLRTMHHVQVLVEKERAQLHATADVASVHLPFDYARDGNNELKLLHAAMGDKTAAYMRDLHQCFCLLRRRLATCPADAKTHMHAMFFSTHRFYSHADVTALLSQHASVLTPRHVAMMLTHCDTTGSGQVDMRIFLDLVQSILPAREALLNHVFRVILPYAAVEKKSASVGGSSGTSAHCRLFKLVAMVKERQAAGRDGSAAALQWLQSFSDPTMTRHAWMLWHRDQSDLVDDDGAWLLFLGTLSCLSTRPRHLTTDNVWGFLALDATVADVDGAAYAALLQQRADAIHARHVLGRRGALQNDMAAVERALQVARTHLQHRGQTLSRVAIAGHTLVATPADVLGDVMSQLGAVESLTLQPMATTIPEAISRVTSLVQLDVAHVGLQRFPASLGALVHLQKLGASNNFLTASSFPATMESLVRLTHVDISANKCTTLPLGFAQLVALQAFDCSANNLQALPDMLFQRWSHLKSLSLHDNRLASLPASLGACSSLTALSCHRNALTRLPPVLASLVQLTDATWHNNQLGFDDDTATPLLHGLAHVPRFTLPHNCLRRIPPATGLPHLRALRVCALGHNDLRDLDAIDFGLLVACVEVDLRENRLKRLPSSLFRMPHLTHLAVQANVLVALPANLQHAPALETLHAHTNHITELPPQLNPSLRHLDLSHNRIQRLPPTWAASTGHRTSSNHLVLETLKLDDNPFDDPALQLIVSNQTTVVPSPSTIHLQAALVKLVDYLDRTTKRSKVEFATYQRSSAANRKAYDLKVRKGQAKGAAEYVEWAFRDVPRANQGGATVAVTAFHRALEAMGAPWTAAEWRRVVHAFEASSDAIDLDAFLDGVEAAKSKKTPTAKTTTTTTAERILVYVADMAARATRCPPREIVPPPPVDTKRPTSATTSPPKATCRQSPHKPRRRQPAKTPRKKTPPTDDAVPRDRQRARLQILAQRLHDPPPTTLCTTPSSSAVVRVECLGPTTTRVLDVPWPRGVVTVARLKDAILAHARMPVSSQVVLVGWTAAGARMRVEDDVVLADPSTTARPFQLIVGDLVEAQRSTPETLE